MIEEAMKLFIKDAFLKHLNQIMFFLEFKEANPFRIRAYRKAIDSIAAIDDGEFRSRTSDGSLVDLDGIGKGILAVARSFLESNTSDEWKEATEGLPLSLMELGELKGLGPKKILQLYEELQIKNLGELEYACKENRLSQVKGLGAKTQSKLLQEIQSLKSRLGQILLSDALALQNEMELIFSKDAKFLCVGDVGRKLEIIHSIAFLLESRDPAKQMKTLISSLEKRDLLQSIDEKTESLLKIFLKSGFRLDIHLVKPENFAIQAVFLTSSEEHWASLQERAAEKSLKLHADGLEKNSKKLKVLSARDLYQHLELEYAESYEREFAVTEKTKFEKYSVNDLSGVFHLHTTYSDGIHSTAEMAKAAQKMGWKFMGISDHSQTAFYARGLDEKALHAQWKEIDELESELQGFRILRGIESDILKDGSLDYPEKILKQFDFVIASIHSRYGMTEMTDRILRAIENPYTTMIGHLTGRLLLARDPYQVDYETLTAAAIKHRKIIELNSHPQRLDIDWRHLARAAKKGLMISINPDAHAKEGFHDVQYGIWMARKAGVPKQNILNLWPLEKILGFLDR